MKKVLLSLSVLSFVLFSTASHAYSLRSGVYMGLSAGAAYSSSKMDGKKKSENDTVFVSSLALGARLHNVRFAAEATMNTKAEYKDYTYESDSISAQLYYDVPFRSADCAQRPPLPSHADRESGADHILCG